MNSNYFTRCSSVNYSVAAGGGGGGMEAAVTGRRRTTTHAEEEEAEEEEEEDGEEEEEEDALVTANAAAAAAISHPAIAPFRYLINEQAKSFVVLQELQNEVGALLEFRDLVMETFPHLRQKTGGPRVTAVGGGQGGGKHWEPGVRVKRKLHQLHSRSDQTQHDSHDLAAPRSRSNSHGKGGGSAVKSGSGSGINEAAANSGTSSAGSSAVQDSGFCADSSKEHCSTSAASRGKEAEADDELWNLLDMIHVKGTRLRLQVEHLQHKLDERERVSASPSPGFRRRSRSLEYVSSKTTAAAAEHHLHQQAGLRLSVESEMRALKQERDELLERLADMEAEKRRHLQLRAATATATVDHLKQEDGFRIDRLQAEQRQLRAPTPTVDHLRPEDGFRIQATADHLKQEDGFRIHRRSDFLTTPPRLHRTPVRLGTLDGIVSSPSPRIKGARGVTLDKNKTAAILAEFNPHELQRHLLFTTFQYQIANSRIERLSRSYVDIHHQVEKFKEENDDLRFQLEEKSIELEGTRARIRLLERLQSAKFAATDSSVVVGGGETLSNTPTPNLMLAEVNTAAAGDCEPNAHHSSSTESAHEDATRLESPKKRPPSKIPLKSYTAPKPPVARPPQSLGAGNRSKSREARTASPCHTQTTGRESLRRPRKTSSSTPTSFSSTGSSHSTPRSLKKPPSSSSRVPPPAAVADQGEHKKTTTSAVVKEPERLEKTEEFVDSLDNGQQESSNCNNCTFLGNQELDRSMSSVAQSRGWLVNSPRPRHFFDSLSADREAMAESDSLEPSCSDLV